MPPTTNQPLHSEAKRSAGNRGFASLLPPLLLFLLTAITFARTLSFYFLNWDDPQHLLQNPSLNPPTLANILHLWLHPYFGLYIPLTYTVWGILIPLARLHAADNNGLTLNPHVFHAANVLLHSANAVLVYYLLRRLLPRASAWPALAGALLWAIHPLQVEPVAWIAGLKDILFAFFSFLALHAYLTFLDAPPSTPAGSVQSPRIAIRGFHPAFLGTLFLALAMFAKPMAVVVPLLAVALTYWSRPKLPRRAQWLLAIWLALALLAAAITQIVQPPAAMTNHSPAWARPLIATDAIAFYLYKLLLPIHLDPDYTASPLNVIATGRLFFTWLAPALVLFLFWKRRPYRIAFALFVLGLLPVIGLIPFHFQEYSTVANRYAYLALLGPALAFAYFLSRARRPAHIAGALILAAFVVATEFELPHWHDSISLWQHEVAEYPNSWLGNGNLGAALIDAGRPLEAAPPTLEALRLKPDYAVAHTNLGILYHAQGHLDEAIKEYKLGLLYDKNYLLTYRCLGDAWMEKGRPDLAEQLFSTGLLIDPNSPELKQGLARAKGKS